MLHETKKLLRLSLPILVAQLSITSMNLVDTVMAGRYSRDALAGVAIGGSFWLPALMFTQAVLFAVTPFVAQAMGRGEHRHSGTYLKQGLWLGLITGCVVWAFFMAVSYFLLPDTGADPEVLQVASDYLFWILPALPIAALQQAMRSFVEGSGSTKSVMAVNVIGLLLNIPLNYIFVYGKLGAPEMGGAGCGVATALAIVIMMFCLWVYIRVGRLREASSAGRWYPNVGKMRQLAVIGFPIAFTLVAEVGIFAVLALIIAPLGTETVAGHQVALNLSSQTFMVPLSICMALTVRVGYCLGANDWQALKHTIAGGYLLGIGGALITAGLLFFGARELTALYTDDKHVQAIAMGLLLFPVLYQVPDAIQACSAGILRGFKVTRSPMVGVLLAYWAIALPIGYTLGRTDWLVPAMGASGLWLGLVLGLSLAALVLFSLVVLQLKRTKHQFNPNNL